ncbi:MAG: metallophosphoesterase [Bifidobacteriaceae bacterium]|jgi:hypothetical protein|nr:metallophosphoesterase [Bifidobacteriaceae bacterium]
MKRRRWVWWLYGVLALAPALVVGLTTAETDYPFGPHEATYHVTVDSRLSVDLGPLGAAVMPSPLGFVGARVVVGPIPADLATSSIPSVATLAGDLTEYGQAYLGIDQTLRQAVIGLLRDGLMRAGILWAGAMIASVLVRLALGRARRTQLRMWAGRHKRATLGAVAGVMVAGLCLGGGVVAAAQPRNEPPGEPLLKGTPLEGAYLTGRLGQVISQYGAAAVKAYEDNVAFYDKAAANVEAAFADQALAATGRVEATGSAAPSPESASPAEDAEGAEGASASPGSASPEPSPTPPWLRGKGPYGTLRPVLFFSDLHCNVGMARVLGAAARGLGTQVVLDGGDTTMDGTAVERYCIDQIAAALPPEATWVSVLGNHDTLETAKQEKAAGATVLEGQVVTVAGLRILGDADPTHTEVAAGTSLRGEEDLTDVAARLADVACADKPVDLLLVHRPVMAMAALERGCVPAAVTGHMHSRANPRVVGRGVFYTQASTGRDNAETTNLGPLGSPAEMTILLFDAEGHLAAWQLLTVKPDASAKLSGIKAWPELPKPVPAGPEDTGGAPPGAR